MTKIILDENPERKTKRLEEENIRLKRDIRELRIMYKSVVDHATLLENELEKKLREITVISSTDTITKIYNRKKFNECLVAEIEREKRYGGGLALIMFDIDYFKQINDHSGHDFGDRVLVEVSNLVNESLRESDIFGRWGGDEFVILTTNTSVSDAGSLAERIRLKIQNHYFNNTIPTTCSFGVARFFENDTNGSFIKRADNALYEAKNNGKNCVRCSPYQ